MTVTMPPVISRIRQVQARSVVSCAAAIATVAGLAMGASRPVDGGTEAAQAAEPGGANRSLEPTSIDPPRPARIR